MSELRVLIAGGGTRGHLFPGMAVAQALQSLREVEVRFVGTDRGIEAKAVPAAGWRLYKLSVSGLYQVGPVKKLLGLLRLPVALGQAVGILWSFRPQVVIGVGGYASGPMLLAALALGFRTVIQEQNAYPGMTNRVLGRRVPLSFVPFAGLEGLFKNPVVVGNPIRQEILQAAATPFQRSETPFTLALVGGSQGARAVNRAMVEALPLLKDAGLRVLHQTGKADFEEIKQAYQVAGVTQAELLPFVTDMAGWYQRADLVVGRAGSMVAELCAMGRASILVPFPNSSGDHQKKNAQALVAAGAAVMIEQSELTGSKLAQEILTLVQDQQRRLSMEQAAKSLYSGDAALEMAKKILEFYRL